MSTTLYKLLKDKKVADSFHFYTSCEYKLYFAESTIQALKNVISKYQTDEKQRVQKVMSDAFETGEGIYIAHNDTTDFLGVEMSVTSVMDKLTMEIMGLFHNFFDTYAQWLNAALLGEESIDISKATLVNLTKKLTGYPEYAGTFLTKLLLLTHDPMYQYIADFNNTLKHRYQIYVKNTFDILALEGNVSIPPFTKDGRIHLKEDAIRILENCMSFCKRLLSDSRNYVEQYYSNNDCNYVSHRLYNPKTYLLFESKENRTKFLPLNHYYYIEVDPANVPDKVQIMLCCDRMDNPAETEKTIECYNSPYQIIMMRKINSQDIIGILTPDDSESFELQDEHELIYRQYSAKTSDYEYEKAKAICASEGDSFKYHPFLTDRQIVIINEESDAPQ